MVQELDDVVQYHHAQGHPCETAEIKWQGMKITQSTGKSNRNKLIRTSHLLHYLLCTNVNKALKQTLKRYNGERSWLSG